MAHRAAHDPAQDITPAFVGGEHAVGDEEARGAEVIGDDAVAGLLVADRFGAGQFLRRVDQRFERVSVVIVGHALHDGGDPLEPHAGVDRRLGQIGDDLVGLLQILHEDEVPDLDKAIAILVGTARGAAGDVVAVIVEDLAARPARPVRPHRPEIILGGDANDAVFGQPGDLFPQVEGQIVIMVDGDGQPVAVEAPFPGQQRPGVGDRLLLEIIAEAEIAEHFEEGVVARGVADIVEVVMLAAGADAFLAARRGLVRARFEASEDVLERHHPGIDEHQGRVVVRHERRGGDAGMPLPFEIIEETAADVVGRCHGGDLRCRVRCGKGSEFRVRSPI